MLFTLVRRLCFDMPQAVNCLQLNKQVFVLLKRLLSRVDDKEVLSLVPAILLNDFPTGDEHCMDVSATTGAGYASGDCFSGVPVCATGGGGEVSTWAWDRQRKVGWPGEPAARHGVPGR